MPLNLLLPSKARRLGGRVTAADRRAIERVPRLRRYARLTFLILH